MITLMSPPAMPMPPETEALAALLKLLADPAATAARLEKFKADVELNRSAVENSLRALHATLSDGLTRREADLAGRVRDHEAQRDAWTRTSADEKAELERLREEIEKRRAALEAAAAEVGRDLPGAR